MTKRVEYSNPAVERVFAVLDLLSHHAQGLRLVDVVEQLDLPKTTAFVLLRSLEGSGYLSEANGRYRLSLKLHALARRAMSNIDIVSAAQPHLERLAAETELTVHLAQLERGEVVYLAKMDGPGFVRFDTYVGKRAPAHLTAVGKAILAYLSEDDLATVERELDFSRGTSKAIRSATRLHEALDMVRSCGFAVEDGEEVEGVRCVSAPIRPPGGGVIASVGVIGLQVTLTDEALTVVGSAVSRAVDLIAAEAFT